MAGSIDRRTFCFSLPALIRPGLVEAPSSFPFVCIATLSVPRSTVRSLRAAAQPPLRQPHSPFTLFLSEILERQRWSFSLLFLPALFRLPLPLYRRRRRSHPPPQHPPSFHLPTASAVFLPSGCARGWVTLHLRRRLPETEGVKSLERNGREKGGEGGWSGPVVGRYKGSFLEILFVSPFAARLWKCDGRGDC